MYYHVCFMGMWHPPLQFLAELGIEEVNAGVYNGAWGGSGSLVTSHSPATGKPIARVRQSTVEEYESCIAAMVAAQEAWQLVRPMACLYIRVVMTVGSVDAHPGGAGLAS